MANINDREYEFADLTLFMAGREVSRFTGIKYSENQTKELLYGKGNRPVSIQKGKISYAGELTVSQSELESLKLLGKGSVLGLHLTAVVTYGDPTKGDALTIDRLEGVQFTKSEKEFKHGSAVVQFTLPFICLEIEKQA